MEILTLLCNGALLFIGVKLLQYLLNSVPTSVAETVEKQEDEIDWKAMNELIRELPERKWVQQDKRALQIERNGFRFTANKRFDNDDFMAYRCYKGEKILFNFFYNTKNGLMFNKIGEDIHLSQLEYHDLKQALLETSPLLHDILTKQIKSDDTYLQYKNIQERMSVDMRLFTFIYLQNNQWERRFRQLKVKERPVLFKSSSTRTIWKFSHKDTIVYKTVDSSNRFLHVMFFDKKRKEYSVPTSLLGRDEADELEKELLALEQGDVQQAKEKEVSVATADVPVFHSIQKEIRNIMMHREWMSEEEIHLLTYTLPNDIASFQEKHNKIAYSNPEEVKMLIERVEKKLFDTLNEVKTNIGQRQLNDLKKETLVIEDRG